LECRAVGLGSKNFQDQALYSNRYLLEYGAVGLQHVGVQTVGLCTVGLQLWSQTTDLCEADNIAEEDGGVVKYLRLGDLTTLQLFDNGARHQGAQQLKAQVVFV